MFERLELLVGKEALNKIHNTSVLVIGLGGVGGYVTESLIRSGIENITIVDYDTIDESNINRQIIALQNNIGKLKTDEFEKRILNINKNVKVEKKNLFIDENSIDSLFNKNIDYVIDACDTINTKKLIIDRCIKNNIKFITCMGTGKRINPSKLVIGDLKDTSYDPIARILRKHVKESGIKQKVICCYSKEKPLKYDGKAIASNSFVPSSAGLLITSYVIRDICCLKEAK